MLSRKWIELAGPWEWWTSTRNYLQAAKAEYEASGDADDGRFFSTRRQESIPRKVFWGLGSTDFYVLPAWNRTPKIPFSSKDPCNPRKDLPRVKDSPGGPQATMAWPPPAFQQHLPASRENTFLRIPLLRKFAYFHALVRSGLSEMCFPPGYHDLCLIIGQGDD